MIDRIYRRRTKVITILFIFIWFICLSKLFYLQVITGKKIKKFENSSIHRLSLYGRRGAIYDRFGRVLATDIRGISIYVRKNEVVNGRNVCKNLEKMGFGDKDSLLNIMNNKRNYILIKRGLPLTYSLPAKMKGVELVEEWTRFYPNKEICGNLLGFVGKDGNGLEGMEYYLNRFLKGKNGWGIFERSDAGRLLPLPEYNELPPEPGENVYLTIDLDIQYILDEELKNAVKKFKASSGIAVCMNVKTGEILGVANVPEYNPNLMGSGKPDMWRNRLSNWKFEPGSIFKIVPASAYIEKGYPISKTITSDNEVIKIGNKTIKDIHSHPSFTFEDALVYSSNVGFVKVGNILGKNLLYLYAKEFGFGAKTPIGMPAVSSGYIPSILKLRNVDFANLCFGQGLSVTPIQIVSAYQSIANIGIMLKPLVVRKIENNNRVIYKANSRKIRRTISDSTAIILTKILTEVVRRGTGKAAKVTGLSIAGKTGTAQKYRDGTYDNNLYVSSFIGYFPAENPQMLVGVFIDEPRRAHLASEVTAPVFSNIVKRIISLPEYRHLRKCEVAKVMGK